MLSLREGIQVFLISEKRILEDLILPQLPIRFSNSTVDDYEIAFTHDENTGEAQEVLQLKTGKKIKLPPVRHLLKDYVPQMTSLSISLENDKLIFSTKTEIHVELGMIAWCTTEHHYKFKIDENIHGEKSLNFEEAQDAIVKHGVDETAETGKKKDIILVIGIVADLVLAVFTGGFGAIIGGIILSLLTGLIYFAGETIISMEDKNISPSLDLAFDKMTSPIKWNIDDKFVLNSVTLAGPLQFGVTPQSTKI
ncbi:TULIP family P47-like protein (plasmid) [Bacillus toyonensis]